MKNNAASASMGSVSDQQFRILVASIRDYAIFLLDTHGHIVSWNEGAHRIKGYDASEVLGKHFSMFYPPETASDFGARLLATAEQEGRAEDFGWRVRRDGTRFWASVVLTALRDEAGELFGYAKVTRDMTDRAYRTFIEATNAIVWTTDRDGHPNTDSPSWRAFTGASESDWSGPDPWDPIHPEDRERIGVTWAAAMRDKNPFDDEFRLRRHDGEYVWIAAQMIPLFAPDGRVREWFGAMFDVSARKRAELDLGASLERERTARVVAEQAQARWTTTLRSIGEAVIATDANGTMTFMNGVAEELTGWTSDEGQGRPLREVFSIVDEHTRQPAEDPVARVIREDAVIGVAAHTVLVRRDGVDVPIDCSVAPIVDDGNRLVGVVIVFRDVTEKKREEARRDFLHQAGEELLASTDYRAALRTVVRLAVPRLADWCAVDVVDTESNDLQRLEVAHVDPQKVNMALELGRKYPSNRDDHTGVRNVLRTGRTELHRVIPTALLEQAAVDDEHRDIIRGLRLHSAMIVPLRGRDEVFGAISFVYAESGREYDEEDVIAAEDLARRAALVIERRKLADERAMLLESERTARAQAELANRSKDQFLAMVSHELRNPLSAIVGWAKLLMKRELSPELRKPIETIERNARNQSRLIEDMLDVSRIMSGKLRLDVGDASVEQAIADAASAVHQAAEAKNVTVATEVEPGLVLRADSVRLAQIVSNLVNNAVKFSLRDGRVNVTARRSGDTVRIVVEDAGDGIEPSMLEAIFEPFRQVDATTTRVHGGLGLGLAIVRHLVMAHGGVIRAESAGPGHGSTFIVDLPVGPARHDLLSSSPAIKTSPLPRLDRIRVLVVDDQAEIVELLTRLLESAGARVTGASSAAEALASLRSTRPDVIVSDIAMPEIDGCELIRRIRSLPQCDGGQTPAIALSAYVRQEDADRALASGFQRHLTKPIEPREFFAAIASIAGVPLDP